MLLALSQRSRMIILYCLPGLVIGIIAGALWQRGSNYPAVRQAVVSEDHNRDGKPDAIFHYTNDFVTLAEYDRNFDGALDFWFWYLNGIVFRAEADENFDGAVDTWDTYLHGNPIVRKADTDWNGVPDVTHEYDHGVLAKSSWHPNGSKIVRMEFLEHGVNTHQVIDSDGDGVFETRKHFDPFGNELLDEPRTR